MLTPLETRLVSQKDNLNDPCYVKNQTFLRGLKEYITAAKNIFFPQLCMCCGQKILRGYLCAECQGKIVFLSPSVCRYCALGIDKNLNPVCKGCAGKIHPYDRLISLTVYKEPIISLIYLFKYKNYDYIAELLASLMQRHLLKIGFDACGYHFTTSVAMHKHKLKMRGYNQADILAKLLSNYFKIPFKNDIINDTNIRSSQTKLNLHERQKNVKGAFVVKKDLKNKRIILVDDIFTTGATIRSCCQALKNKGAKIITVLTLSKTQQEKIPA